MDVYLAGLMLLAAGGMPSWNAVNKAASDRVLTFTVIQAVGTVLGFGVAVFVGVRLGSGGCASEVQPRVFNAPRRHVRPPFSVVWFLVVDLVV